MTKVEITDAEASRTLEENELEQCNGGADYSALLHPGKTWDRMKKDFGQIADIFSKVVNPKVTYKD